MILFRSGVIVKKGDDILGCVKSSKKEAIFKKIEKGALADASIKVINDPKLKGFKNTGFEILSKDVYNEEYKLVQAFIINELSKDKES